MAGSLIASRKARGRRHQQWVRDKILEYFPDLTLDDVRSTSMGASGADIQLSAEAKEKCPISIECKNQEAFTNIYNAYDQAVTNSDRLTPVVVIKQNKKKPLVILDFDDFMTMFRESLRRI